DSARVWAASFDQPRSSCIFECRKYWLMAVSSAVSCSLSSSMTFLSPFMAPPGVDHRVSPPGRGWLHGGLEFDGLIPRASLPDDRRDVAYTVATIGAGTACCADFPGAASACSDVRLDVVMRECVAAADDHESHPSVTANTYLGCPNLTVVRLT